LDTKRQFRKLKNELDRLAKRAGNQRSAWETVGGMVYRRIAVDWFRRAMGNQMQAGGGPKDNPWRALKSESYVRRKERKGKTKKLVYSGVFRQSYYYQPGNTSCIIGNRDYRKAVWLERMGFEVLSLENDIKENAGKILIDYIWNK